MSKTQKAVSGLLAATALTGVAAPALADPAPAPVEQEQPKKTLPVDETELDTAINEAKEAGLTVNETDRTLIPVTVASGDEFDKAKADAENTTSEQVKKLRDAIAAHKEAMAEYEKQVADHDAAEEAYKTAQARYEDEKARYEDALSKYDKLVADQTLNANPDDAIPLETLGYEQPIEFNTSRASLAGAPTGGDFKKVSRDFVGQLWNSDYAYQMQTRDLSNPITATWNNVATDKASGRALNATVEFSDGVYSDLDAKGRPANITVFSNFIDNASIANIAAIKEKVTLVYADNGEAYDKPFYLNFGSLNAQPGGGENDDPKRYEFSKPVSNVVASFVAPDTWVGHSVQEVHGPAAASVDRAYMVQMGTKERHGIADTSPAAMTKLGVSYLVNNGAEVWLGTSGQPDGGPQKAKDFFALYNHIMLSAYTTAPTEIRPLEPTPPTPPGDAPVVPQPAPVEVSRVSLEVPVQIDPHKRVENGEGVDVDGKGVVANDRLEYKLRLSASDLTDTVSEVKRLALVDTYDKDFAPVKDDVKAVWADTGEAVDMGMFNVQWDDEAHTVTFEAKNPADFLGRDVVFTLPGGIENGRSPEVLVNSAKQVTNDYNVDTETVRNPVPVIDPEKFVTAPEDGANIDGKTVAKGDTLQYLVVDDTEHLTDTVNPVKSHGLRDKFDAEKGSVDPGKVQVYQVPGSVKSDDLNTINDLVRADAKNVTDQYTVTVDEGGLHAMMNVGEDGTVVLPMGYKYVMVMPYLVTADVDGDIENTAFEVHNGVETQTQTVVNRLTRMSPEKDVVVSADNAQSINGQMVPMHTVFAYKLDSSVRPGNYGGETKSWSITDDYDETHDEYKGNFRAVTNHDIVMSDGSVLKAGADITEFVTQTVDAEKGMVRYDLNDALLKALLSEKNRASEQSFSVFMQVQRVAPGDVVNTFQETYNGVERDSNEVKTHTPSPEVPKPPRVHTGGAVEGQDGVAGVLAGVAVLLAAAGTALGLRRRKTAKEQ